MRVESILPNCSLNDGIEVMKKIELPYSDDDLLAECEVQTYRSSGAGGQHVNVTNSAVRLIHHPSGIVITSQTERSQFLNKRECLIKLREKVEKLNYRKPKRIATRVPRSVIAKNAAKKTKTSEKKRLRRISMKDSDI